MKTNENRGPSCHCTHMAASEAARRDTRNINPKIHSQLFLLLHSSSVSCVHCTKPFLFPGRFPQVRDESGGDGNQKHFSDNMKDSCGALNWSPAGTCGSPSDASPASCSATGNAACPMQDIAAQLTAHCRSVGWALFGRTPGTMPTVSQGPGLFLALLCPPGSG